MSIQTLFSNIKWNEATFRIQLARMMQVFFILVFLMSAVGVTPAQAATSSIWPEPITPTFPYYNNLGPIEVGLKFRADIAGYVTGVRYFKGPGSTGTHIGHLWNMAGEKLAKTTFTNETASGWQQALFPALVAIQPNTTYIISYYVADGNRMLAISQNFFTSSGVTNGHLYALRDNEDGHNGVFSETGGFFNQDNLSSNYWVDLIFDDTPDTTPPTVTSVSPTDGATGIFASTNISTVFSEAMNASSINTSSFVLRDQNNNDVTATISYDQASHTAVLNPNSNLNFSTTYTAIFDKFTPAVYKYTLRLCYDH